MNLDAAVLRFAGVVVMASALLSIFVHPYWIGLTIFAGFNMFQASFTGLCPAAMVFKKLGVKPGNAFR
ncbi:YgaP family membrane protein [Novosphingobium naphthalenivorans]|uniref:YgaP family membrane protein n=1 Tax=Novosphingobium naphthalenivorans TaxID=273168 RepID=UPI00082F90F7|nr:DUF2892 domain-containing protein [Novosphingobium naphthalenivorans]